jgi:methionyl-tRNA synthetase
MQDFSPFYSPFAPGLMLALVPLFALAALWTVIIKGFALWHSARAGQKWWFIALLIVNTLGILEVIYLIWFRPSHSGTVHTPAHHSSAGA